MDVMKTAFIPCILVAWFCLATESFAWGNAYEPIQWGQGIQEFVKTKKLSSYIEGETKSIFTGRSTQSLLANVSFFHTKATAFYTFDDGKLREIVIHIKDVPHQDALYKRLESRISHNHISYSGELFSGFDERFTDKKKTTLVFMAKGDGIFIYFLDYRYYEHYKK